MVNLKSHEQIVLDILTSNILSHEKLKSILMNGEITGYKITGNGYFLTFKESNIPKNRIVCDKPILIGEYNGIETGFVVFVENGEMTIECHGWGDKEIPKDYREWKILIKQGNPAA
jgi:hypothetical protein